MKMPSLAFPNHSMRLLYDSGDSPVDADCANTGPANDANSSKIDNWLNVFMVINIDYFANIINYFLSMPTK
jgi:hypothetical protein